MLNERRDRVARAMAVLALAWGGTILGHLSSYVLAYPRHGSRAGHLAATGHGSFQTVMMTAAAAVALGVGLIVLRALRPRSTFALRRLTLALGAVQVPAFAFLETAERGFDPGAAAADPAVLMGLMVQVVLAGLLALAVVGLARSIRALFVQRRITSRRASVPSAPRPAPFVDLRGFLRARPLRGPPLTLGS